MRGHPPRVEARQSATLGATDVGVQVLAGRPTKRQDDLCVLAGHPKNFDPDYC